jgi:hypothetical protein
MGKSFALLCYPGLSRGKAPSHLKYGNKINQDIFGGKNMKFRVAITIPLALFVTFYLATPGFATSSNASKKDEKVTENQLKIGVSPPMWGTVAFNALMGSRDIPGVEIRVDGEEKGITDEKGELLVKWLVTGKHRWSAFYEGEEVSQGEFEVSKITDARIIDRKIRLNGKEYKESVKFCALKDNWTFIHTLKNTGTTVIDHYSLELTSSSGKGSSMKIKLISPPIPGWIWKPFAGNLKTGRRRMEVVIKDDGVEMNDGCSAHPIENVTLETATSKGGLWPGETITVAFEEPYTKCLEEFYQCMAAKLNTEITNEIADVDNAIMNLMIKKYKVSFFTFNDVKVKLTLKGINKKETCSLYLYIDDKLCDTVPWFEYEWL